MPMDIFALDVLMRKKANACANGLFFGWGEKNHGNHYLDGMQEAMTN